MATHMGSVFDIHDARPIENPEQPTKKRGKKRDSLTASDVTNGKVRLADMVNFAFNTLETAMQDADFPTAVKAAQIVLDRAGFGPKSTVDLNATHVDLSNLTREELAARAERVVGILRNQRDAAAVPVQEPPRPQ